MTTPLAPAHPVAVRGRPVRSPAAIARADRRLSSAPPADVVRWARRTFGSRLVLAASFADTVLIDVAMAVDPDIEVVFLDTGFHFAETLATVRRAMDRYGFHLTVLRPSAGAADVWAAGNEACCAHRKTEPFDHYVREHADAWLSGLRRADHPGRASAPVVGLDHRGLVKVNPLAGMSDADHDAYVAEHDVLVNPLRFDGYGSIGCWPCTERAAEGRSGRWPGTTKTECGLHR